MKFSVTYSGNAYDCTAYFDSAVDHHDFATMMAEQGRMIRAMADGLDITDKFVTIVTFAELARR